MPQKQTSYLVTLVLLTLYLIVLSFITLAGVIALISFNKNFINGFFDFTRVCEPDTCVQNIYWFYKQPTSYILLCPSFMLISHFIISASNQSLNYCIILSFLTIFLIIVSVPMLAGAIILISTNKFFTPTGLTDPEIHLQNLLWFYKQPTSYILLCPSFMLISHFIIRVSVKPLNYYIILNFIWFTFFFLMSLSVHTRIIDTYVYILYSFVMLYIIYVYIQL